MRRSALLVLVLSSVALAGCCGFGAADPSLPMSAAPQDAGARAAPNATAAMASDVAPTGCTIQGGVACDGQEIAGGRFDFPNPRTIMRVLGLATGPVPGFRAQNAQAANADCQTPAATRAGRMEFDATTRSWFWNPNR